MILETRRTEECDDLLKRKCLIIIIRSKIFSHDVAYKVGRRKVEDGRWKMEGGRWKVEDGRWKMEERRKKKETLLK
jgi:hypothetical protein